MSKIEINFAELHNPLFFGKRNFGTKLDPRNDHKSQGVRLVYDRPNKELLVTLGDQTAIIPSSNIVSMVEGPVEDRKIVQMGAPMVAGIGSAQVETPMSHVHAGHGHGKTGKSK